MSREGGSAEKCTKGITLLSIEIDLERTRIIHRTITRFAVVRNKIIVIICHISQHIKRPLLRRSPRHHQLIVEKVRSILTFRVKRSQKVTRGLITSRRHHRKLFISPTEIDASTQHGAVDGRFPLFGATISNVQNRRHLITILRFEAARRKLNAFHHRTVDDRKSFLLTGAHQLRTIKFYPVEIYDIFVKRSSAHIIL